MEYKMGMSWVTAEGYVAKGPSIVPFWIATGSRNRSPLPLSNFLSLLLLQGSTIFASSIIQRAVKDVKEPLGFCSSDVVLGANWYRPGKVFRTNL